jgi:hypothetical protein
MTETPTACPLCGLTDDPDDVYRHLQVAHRKSAISEALLDTAGARTEPAPSD